MAASGCPLPQKGGWTPSEDEVLARRATHTPSHAYAPLFALRRAYAEPRVIAQPRGRARRARLGRGGAGLVHWTHDHPHWKAGALRSPFLPPPPSRALPRCAPPANCLNLSWAVLPSQCRERWNNQMRPNINRGSWTEEEEAALVAAHKELGNRWAGAATLPRARAPAARLSAHPRPLQRRFEGV